MASFNHSSDGAGFWQVSSSRGGVNRVCREESVRRQALCHAVSLDEYNARFDRILAWRPCKSRASTIGGVRIEWRDWDF